MNKITRNTVSSDGLRSYIERIERVNAEIVDLTSDRRDIFKEVKTDGLDAHTIRTIIKRRAMKTNKRRTMDEMLDQYMSALGDFAETSLGEAGAERIRNEVR